MHVVLRKANERTASAAEKLISSQCPPEIGLTLIEERPFEKALKACYNAGLDAGREWTVTIDADMLLLPGAIDRLVESAIAMPECNIELEGRVFDKVIGVYRPAGLRIYRTELLDRAMKLIPPYGQVIRPEYETLQAMGRLGYPSRFIPDVLALHDFEQFYFDLYRKSFVHARKHAWLVGSILERCQANIVTDPDFLVILKGLWDGLTTNDTVSIDRQLFVEKGERALQELGLMEKEPIETEAFIRNFESFSAEAMQGHDIPNMETYDQPTPSLPPGLAGSVVHRIRKRGLLRGSVASFGALLCKIGRSLDT